MNIFFSSYSSSYSHNNLMSLSEYLNNPSVLILDCRSVGEFNSGDAYKGAVNIPVAEVESRLSECGDDKSRPVVCYCGAGVRAARAAACLKEHGYTNVISAANANALRTVKPQ